MFKVKYNSDSSIKRYKARFVIQKFSQVYKINYIETFVPTIGRELLRIFLAITTMLKMILIQIDVISTYLESAFA